MMITELAIFKAEYVDPLNVSSGIARQHWITPSNRLKNGSLEVKGGEATSN